MIGFMIFLAGFTVVAFGVALTIYLVTEWFI